MRQEYYQRIKWAIELSPGVLAGKGLFVWPEYPWNQGNMIAVFPSRQEARKNKKKLSSNPGFIPWPKARVV